jgi:uncharacterized iron-regulated membrane protein
VNDTFHWIYRLAAVLGFAVLGTLAFFCCVGVVAWWQRTRSQGFPKTRRRFL